jgi:pyridoxal/pyridoxine/pyridoxamine kinase
MNNADISHMLYNCRDEVVPIATILTPNQFECELLSEKIITDLPSAFEAVDVLHAKGAKIVIVTSSNLPAGQEASMLLLASCPWGASVA